MTKSHEQISMFLSYVLRHKPDAIGLELDPEGWASIQELVQRADIEITPEVIKEVVATNDKQRFTISPDGLLIRANQGHSLNIDLGLQPVQPPEYLFHGSAIRFLASILEQGIHPQSRQFVHLSGDVETATEVGRRYGKPVVLRILAQKMHKAGHVFFQAENGVWLTKAVPPRFIETISTSC